MGIFNRKPKPQTMQELLESNPEFKHYIEETMYHVWYRGTLATGEDSLDNFINLFYSNYEGGVQPSEMAHTLINMGGNLNV
jgi:hypothetical protein